MWYIGATICILNNQLQKLSKKNFIWKKWKGWKNESQSLYRTISLVPLNIFAPRDKVKLYPSLFGGQWPNDDLVN
jgi:hypothetical protein